MNEKLIEQFLYEEEGPTLDFKRDQYVFVKATDEDKSELLKDILGFVNCWRRGEAIILIGVVDVRGGRGMVHGISEHLLDQNLQQFVNSLTNRSVSSSTKPARLRIIRSVSSESIWSSISPFFSQRTTASSRKIRSTFGVVVQQTRLS